LEHRPHLHRSQRRHQVGTTSLTGTGTPDTWYEIASASSDTAIVLDSNGPNTSGAVTYVIRQHCIFDGVKTYDLESAFGLQRVRTLHSIRLIDGASSVKLFIVDARKKDQLVPRPESYTEGASTSVTQFSRIDIEFNRIPDTTYPLEFRWSAHPTAIGDLATSDALDLKYKDELVVAMTCWRGYAALQENEDATYWRSEVLGSGGLLAQALRADTHRPDDDHLFEGEPAREASLVSDSLGEYWLDPVLSVVMGNP